MGPPPWDLLFRGSDLALLQLYFSIWGQGDIPVQSSHFLFFFRITNSQYPELWNSLPKQPTFEPLPRVRSLESIPTCVCVPIGLRFGRMDRARTCRWGSHACGCEGLSGMGQSQNRKRRGLASICTLVPDMVPGILSNISMNDLW